MTLPSAKGTCVGIVIVHCGGEEMLENCICTLERQTWQDYGVWVVDNGSTDGSAERVATRHVGVEVVRLGENRGWSGGNNAGIRKVLESGVEWVWLLNNDTLVGAECLEKLLNHVDKNRGIKVLSPVVRHAPPSDRVWFQGGVVDFERLELTGTASVEEFRDLAWPKKPYISGCAMLVHRTAFERVGLIDERFFLYCEDVDFTIRVVDAGMGVDVVSEAEIRHLVSQSTGGERKNNPLRVYFFFLSTMLFWRKVLGFWEFHTRFLRVFLNKRIVSKAEELAEVEWEAYADALWHMVAGKRCTRRRTVAPAWFRHLLERKPWVVVAILGFDVGPLWYSTRKRMVGRGKVP